MQKRSPVSVALLTLVTFGIYGIVWYVKTKEEMNKQGANIPTAWLLIIPIVGIYWLWKYSEGVEQVTKGKISAILSFVLLYLVSAIGMAIVQDSFNNAESVAVDGPAGYGTSGQYGAPSEAPVAAQVPAQPATTITSEAPTAAPTETPQTPAV